jgi:hypothetical protein
MKRTKKESIHLESVSDYGGVRADFKSSYDRMSFLHLFLEYSTAGWSEEAPFYITQRDLDTLVNQVEKYIDSFLIKIRDRS